MSKFNEFVTYTAALGVLAGSIDDCRLDIQVHRDLRCDGFALLTSASSTAYELAVQDTTTGVVYGVLPRSNPGIYELS